MSSNNHKIAFKKHCHLEKKWTYSNQSIRNVFVKNLIKLCNDFRTVLKDCVIISERFLKVLENEQIENNIEKLNVNPIIETNVQDEKKTVESTITNNNNINIDNNNKKKFALPPPLTY